MYQIILFQPNLLFILFYICLQMHVDVSASMPESICQDSSFQVEHSSCHISTGAAAAYMLRVRGITWRDRGYPLRLSLSLCIWSTFSEKKTVRRCTKHNTGRCYRRIFKQVEEGWRSSVVLIVQHIGSVLWPPFTSVLHYRNLATH